MFILSYGKRPVIEESQKVSASSCVRNFLLDNKKSTIRREFNLTNEEDVRNLIKSIEKNININLKQDNSGKIEYSEPNRVKLTYTKSNLGKGFIFWFICNVCSGRVKYLYFPPNSQTLACRKCHKLVYERQNDSKSTRHLNRLFKDNPTP